MRDRDAESRSVGPEPVGERHHRGVAVARDHQPVHLEAVVEALHYRLLVRRLGEGGVQVLLEVVDGAEQEEPALARAVGGLEDGGEAHRLERVLALVDRPHRRELGLRDARLGELPAHGDLVGDAVGYLPPDPGQAELLRDGGHDGDGAVGGDRHDTVHRVLAPESGERGDVEIGDLPEVCLRQARRVGVAVGSDDANAELLRPFDRTQLVPPGAHEKNRLHARAMLSPT